MSTRRVFHSFAALREHEVRERSVAIRSLTEAACGLLEAALALMAVGRSEAAAHLDGLADDLLELAGELVRENQAELLGPAITAQPRTWPPPRKAGS